MSESFAASSQAIAFDSAARCDSGASGPVSPCKRHDDPGGVGGLAFVDRRSPESGKELPRTVWLLLLDDFLRDQLQALFLSLFQRGQRPCRDGQEREPHVQPSTLGRGSGGSAGLGKIFEAINLSLLPSKDSVVSATNFLSIAYPCRSASLSAQSGIGT